MEKTEVKMTLRQLPGRWPGLAVAMRFVLKTLLRRFGLKCLAIHWAGKEDRP